MISPELQSGPRFADSPPATVHGGDPAAPVVDMSQTQSSPEWSGVDVAMETHRPTMTSLQVADLLQRLAGANHALAAGLDAIAVSHRSLSQSTVDRMEHLVEQMRPAAEIRQILAELDPQELLAGAGEWHRRWPATSSPSMCKAVDE
ncbi:MAG TPA: hypothetical protein VIJ23_19180 [Mycobacterium sp.]